MATFLNSNNNPRNPIYIPVPLSTFANVMLKVAASVSLPFLFVPIWSWVLKKVTNAKIDGCCGAHQRQVESNQIHSEYITVGAAMILVSDPSDTKIIFSNGGYVWNRNEIKWFSTNSYKIPTIKRELLKTIAKLWPCEAQVADFTTPLTPVKYRS